MRKRERPYPAVGLIDLLGVAGMLMNRMNEFLSPLLPATMNIGCEESVWMAFKTLALQNLTNHLKMFCIPRPESAAGY